MEKRKYPRFKLKLDAKYKMIDSEKTWKRADAKNISAEGMCFETDEKLKTGAQVELEVNLGDNASAVHLIGEIMWSTEKKSPDGEKKTVINGVRLTNISATDESRFLKYYCDKMAQKLAGYLKM